MCHGEADVTVATLRLDVCCNNPDNGLFAHCAEGLQVTTWDGEDIEFMLASGRAPRFAECGSGFRFMRRQWACHGSREWYGNWCWNAYWMAPADMIELLALVKRSGKFGCEQAPSTLFDDWYAPRDLDKALWKANLWGRYAMCAAGRERTERDA